MILTSNKIHQLKNLKNSQSIELTIHLGHIPVSVSRWNQIIDIRYQDTEIEVKLKDLEKLRVEPDALYYLDASDGAVFKLQLYSEETGQYYRLVYTGETSPPTVEISGIKMHVTEGQDPQIDTRKKLATFREELHGHILDTCCGLGYTAIELSLGPHTQSVTVIEKDPNILTLCRLNPFSAPLFTNEKISLIRGDASLLVKSFPDRYFSFILHDPPRFALAPALYHVDFYRELHRILKDGGEIYHYTGNPNKKLRKQSLQAKTAHRLKEAGFMTVRKVYQGVWAKK